MLWNPLDEKGRQAATEGTALDPFSWLPWQCRNRGLLSSLCGSLTRIAAVIGP
ncbi:hypothetical protein PENFLA_c002G09595 [Penicillium flavigenum]|uniref:Uncharacterized protein n=1 Tax=Penicillium flavigenum TaxID=254877 RepID=A0A1V6TZI4_9EURO|nr:hypothetical protein PENFLA_c002G09595 [Penicillium flavigenum]